MSRCSSTAASRQARYASIVGRFYAMDRDKRWERVKEAYDLLVEGKGKQATDMVQAMQESYDEGVTDEFIKPINNATVDGTIKEGDVVKVTVSKGKYIVLEDYTGKKEDVAKKALEKLKFEVEIEYEISSKTKGTVIDQSIEKGTKSRSN